MVTINTGRQTSPMEGILGLLSGLTQGLNQTQAEKEQRTLQALQLLAQNPRMELQPLSADQAQPSPFVDRLFGGQRYQPTPEGYPVANVGGMPVSVRQRPVVPLSDFFPGLAATAAPAGTAAVPPSPQSLTPDGHVIPPTPPLYAGAPITDVNPNASSAGGTSRPETSGEASARAALPSPPNLNITPQEVAQHLSVQEAYGNYRRMPSEANARLLTAAGIDARKDLVMQRQTAYKDALDRARAERQLRMEERKEAEPSSEFGAIVKKHRGDLDGALAEYQTRQIEKEQHHQEIGLGNIGEKTLQAAVNKPLDEGARVRLNGLLQGEDIAKALATEFTPEERAQFVGLGGLRFTAQQVQQIVADAQRGKADPKFARFAALLHLEAKEAFETGGKALSAHEKNIIFGYIPTGKEMSVEDFEQKLRLAQERLPTFIDRELQLATTPAKDLASARAAGKLGNATAPRPAASGGTASSGTSTTPSPPARPQETPLSPADVAAVTTSYNARVTKANATRAAQGLPALPMATETEIAQQLRGSAYILKK